MTVAEFYRTKEWKRLINLIKLQRINAEGFIICEHCGKPIIKSYDCIGHHVIELTPINVCDAAIALNSNNIKLVHHSCHNKIHHKFGRIEQCVWIVYGPPLSGKTSYVDEVKQKGDLIVDIDSIWQAVSGCKKYIKPNCLKSVVFNVRDTLIESVKHRLGKWENAYIIGGYPLIGERERLIKSMGARDVFIDTPKEICIDRLINCNDERNQNEWIKHIETWFRLYSPPLSRIGEP